MKAVSLRMARRVAAGATLLFLATALASAQTVKPVIDEIVGNPVKGRIEYVNDGLLPLTVVLELRSFTVSETGEASFRPLDPDIHVKLSSASFRVQPQQTFYVFYEATAPKLPSWFVIYANFTGFGLRTAQGMNVRLQLPHTVYMLPKEPLQKSDLQITRAELDAAQNKVTVDVENTSDKFGRVFGTQLVYAKKKQDVQGFPIFPHSKRILEIPLDEKADGENVPLEISMQTKDFKLEQKLVRHNSSEVASTETPAAPTPTPAGTNGGGGNGH